jgi:hypothetical protein
MATRDPALAAALDAASFTWATDTHRFVRRIVQTVAIEADTLTTETEYDVDCTEIRREIERIRGGAGQPTPATSLDQLPAEDAVITVPLVVLPRDRLADLISVEVGSTTLPVLTAREGAYIATSWLEAARDRALASVSQQSLSSELMTRIRSALNQAVAAPNIPTAAALDAVASAADEVLVRLDLPDEAAASVRASCTRFFIWARFFAQHTYLFTRFPFAGDRSTITTNATSHYRDEFPNGKTSSKLARRTVDVRRALGRRTPDLRFPAPQVFATDSFHLKMIVPARMHVHDTWVEWNGPTDTDAADASPRFVRLEPGDSYLMQNERDSSVAHTYLRDVRKHPQVAAAHPRPAVRVAISLAEDLPGSITPAAVPALFIALLALLFGLRYDNILPATGSSDISTAIPVLFFTLPAVAAVWFRGEDAGDLLRRPLISALSPIIVGGFASVFGLLYLLDRLSSDAWLRHSTHMAWWALTGLAIAWALVVLFRVAKKLRGEIPTCR